MGAGGAVLLHAWACTPVRSMATWPVPEDSSLYKLQRNYQLDAKELAAYH